MNHRQHRRGFTLLELLIAIGLTSILMMSLFAATEIYLGLQLDSHEEITRQQIARTLLRQMTRDIQSVVFVAEQTVSDDSSSSSGSSGTSTGSGATSGTGSSSFGGSTAGSGSSGTGLTTGGTGGSAAGGTSSGGSTSGGTSSGTSGSGSTGTSGTGGASSSGSTSAGSVDMASAAMTTYTNGLVGTSSDLLLYISRPDRNLSYVSSQSLSSIKDRTSDLMIVRYLVADSTAGGLASDLADRLAASGERGPVGLVRITGDLYGMSTAIESGDDENWSLTDRIEAREVSAVAFRYFDGMAWQDSWDSGAVNALPLAIEIVLTLRNVQSAGTAFDNEADPRAMSDTTHRMVVNIPIAEPVVTESAL